MVQFGARTSSSHPGGSVADLGIVSRADTVRLGLSHPVIRSRSQTLRLTADFTLRNSRTEEASSLLSDDRLRILSLGLNVDAADRFGGRNLIGFQIAQGLDILNATPTGSANLSRSEGRSDFTKLTLSAQRDQGLVGAFSLGLSLDGQYSA